MWTLYEHHDLAKLLARSVPIEIVKRYEKWKDVVRYSGPAGLTRIRGFRDEALYGPWLGFRSSRLSLQWRVIYRVEAESLFVLVERISPHDYRRT
jgi:mRNA-degrading endonuclease YafQ of YafQ-DinJ toxin-antitoxin module